MAKQREPRPFQRKVLSLVREGKNIILQAPTGAGKTEAALNPFIQNLERGEDKLPSTCLYATPMRVLSTQFLNKYRKWSDSINEKVTASYKWLQLPPVSIQTGEQPEDPQFESILTFCTIDQLLASFLGVPYSMDGRRANLNVAAVAGSYLVLDEFHLYPLLRGDESCFGARTTTLSMLRLLQSTTRFILMTATFSSELLKELARLLNAEVVQMTDEDLRIIASGRERTFEVCEETLTADRVLIRHTEQSCSLVVCNTVLRAQQLYWQIKAAAAQRGIQVVLLHSRLTSADRAARSEVVMHELGQAPEEWEDEWRYGWKDGVYHGKDLIVISTQVVEVGLDISVQILHTELAPANSIIQRAGRCARFAQQQGTVIVYPLRDAEGNEIDRKPYLKDLCDKTWSALQKQNLHNSVVGFREEQALLDAVHTESDKELLRLYKSTEGHGQIVKRIIENYSANKRSIAPTLIRDVEQIHILIHDNPKNVITEQPWNWQSFTLHPHSLASRWSALGQRARDMGIEWVAKKAIAIPKQDEETDNKQKTVYTWEPIASGENTSAITGSLSEALMIALPPQLATYHDELGFILLDGRLDIGQIAGNMTYQSTLLESKNKEWHGYILQQRSYQQHIEGLVKAYEKNVEKRMHYVIRRLEEHLELPEKSIDQAIRLAIACHDLGKLGVDWQKWAWEWQTLLFEEFGYPPLPMPSHLFAKTDFDSSVHKELRKRMRTQRPPHHACESVMLGAKLLAKSLFATLGKEKGGIVVRAACAAIAHHHTADAHTYEAVRLKDGAYVAIEGALQAVHHQQTWSYNLYDIEYGQVTGGELIKMNTPLGKEIITKPRQGTLHELETWLYFVIVRALRLSDQRAEKYD